MMVLHFVVCYKVLLKQLIVMEVVSNMLLNNPNNKSNYRVEGFGRAVL